MDFSTCSDLSPIFSSHHRRNEEPSSSLGLLGSKELSPLGTLRDVSNLHFQSLKLSDSSVSPQVKSSTPFSPQGHFRGFLNSQSQKQSEEEFFSFNSEELERMMSRAEKENKDKYLFIEEESCSSKNSKMTDFSPSSFKEPFGISDYFWLRSSKIANPWGGMKRKSQSCIANLQNEPISEARSELEKRVKKQFKSCGHISMNSISMMISEEGRRPEYWTNILLEKTTASERSVYSASALPILNNTRFEERNKKKVPRHSSPFEVERKFFQEGDNMQTSSLIKMSLTELDFGMVPEGCALIKETALTNTTNECLEIQTKSIWEFIFLYSDVKNKFTRDTLLINIEPYGRFILKILYRPLEHQTKMEKVSCNLLLEGTSSSSGMICERLGISATMGHVKLNIPRGEKIIVSQHSKKLNFPLINLGNIPLILSFLGTNTKLKSGRFILPLTIVIQPQEDYLYRLPIIFESNEVMINENGSLLLQTVPNGRIYEIPFSVIKETLGDFPIEANVSSLYWDGLLSLRQISLKNTSDYDISAKILIDPLNRPHSFFIKDGKKCLKEKSVVFPSNSIITLQLFHDSSQKSERAKLYIKLLEHPLKATINLFVLKKLPGLILYPSNIIFLFISSSKVFTLVNKSNILMSWKAKCPHNIKLSSLSGLLNPRQSISICLSLLTAEDNRIYYIEFEGRVLNRSFSKFTTTMSVVFHGLEITHKVKQVEKMISLKKNRYTFPITNVGAHSVIKIKVKNRTSTARTLFLSQTLAPSPFVLYHDCVDIKSKSYLSFPVQFKPTTLGQFSTKILIKNDITPKVDIYAELIGESA